MKREHDSHTWPFLLILTGLFVLSVTAPRPWERIARKRAIDSRVAFDGRRAAHSDVVAGKPVEIVAQQDEPITKPVVVEPHERVGSLRLEESLVEAATQSGADRFLADYLHSGQVENPDLAEPANQPSLASGVGDPTPHHPATELATVPVPTPPSLIAPNQDLLQQAAPLTQTDVAAPADLVPLRSAPDEESVTPLAEPTEPREVGESAPVPGFEPVSLPGDEHAPAGVAEDPESDHDLSASPPECPPVASADSVPLTATRWPIPDQLIFDLEQLGCECECCEWASHVHDLLQQLTRDSELSSARALQILAELGALSADPDGDDVMNLDVATSIRWRRVRGNLRRQIELWQLFLPLDWSSEGLAMSHANSRLWADAMLNSEQIDRAQVAKREWLSHLNQFEVAALPSQARELSREAHQVASLYEARTREVLNWFEAHYRNANLRVAVSADLMNRLVPPQPPVEQPVRDKILGAETRGWSTASSEVKIRLIPNDHLLRWAIEAKGTIFSRTSATSGPAVLYNHCDSTYEARKLVDWGAKGFQSRPSDVTASSTPRLRGIRTDFDSIPLLGSVVQQIARSKHDQQRGLVRRMANQKVEDQVRQQIDARAQEKIVALQSQMEAKVLRPLREMELHPTIVELQTTTSRVAARLRLAGTDQLAGASPRPRAPADSLASVQLHQSLMNNFGEQLGLNGRTFTLPELQAEIADRLHLPAGSMPNSFPEEMRVTFAKQDSLRAKFADGRVELTLAITELRMRPKVWHRFTVKVYYRPEMEGLAARLVRDGPIQLSQQKSALRGQIALRGVFSKIFSPDRTLELIPSTIASDPRMADVAVSQFVVQDGWLGLAISPSSAADPRHVASRWR